MNTLMISLSVQECVKNCRELYKLKENETTWSKIDSVFANLQKDLNTKEECLLFLEKCSDLLCRSILSDRSKLSGTSISLVNVLVNFLQADMVNVSMIMTSILKVCGRSNKVVYTRGLDAMVNLCKYIDILPFGKILIEHYNSTNKNIRLGVIKGILCNKDGYRFEKLINKGKSDQYLEIRTLCKDNNMRYENKVDKEMINKAVSNKVEYIEKIKEITKTPEYRHSPLKKVFKSDNKESSSNTVAKISELEKQVKNITNGSSSQYETRRNMKKLYADRVSAKVKKDNKEPIDDLTPKKLDRYLSKYRNLYGNILENTEIDDKQVIVEAEKFDTHNLDVIVNESNAIENTCGVCTMGVNTDVPNGDSRNVEYVHTNDPEHIEVANDEHIENAEPRNITDYCNNKLTYTYNEGINAENKTHFDSVVNIDEITNDYVNKSELDNSNNSENKHCNDHAVNQTCKATDARHHDDPEAADSVLENNTNDFAGNVKSQDEPSSMQNDKTAFESESGMEEVDENDQSLCDNHEDEADCLEYEMSNLSIVEDDHKYEYTIVNSELSTHSTLEPETKDVYTDMDAALQLSENTANFEKCKSSTPKSADNGTKQNRFAALLFSDKDDCVIYDINANSPKFKDNIEKTEFSSSVNIKAHDANSSFLYNQNGNGKPSPVDMSQQADQFLQNNE